MTLVLPAILPQSHHLLVEERVVCGLLHGQRLGLVARLARELAEPADLAPGVVGRGRARVHSVPEISQTVRRGEDAPEAQHEVVALGVAHLQEGVLAPEVSAVQVIHLRHEGVPGRGESCWVAEGLQDVLHVAHEAELHDAEVHDLDCGPSVDGRREDAIEDGLHEVRDGVGNLGNVVLLGFMLNAQHVRLAADAHRSHVQEVLE
mmetsp:Transcript_32093/g.95480  ORF Transcript_32093/g.95480 Transcript_32093/m.95480 type:complete len:205 (+) Transcript_32093:992-1606(+)